MLGHHSKLADSWSKNYGPPVSFKGAPIYTKVIITPVADVNTSSCFNKISEIYWLELN